LTQWTSIRIWPTLSLQRTPLFCVAFDSQQQHVSESIK
jgi:hypothetical protein